MAPTDPSFGLPPRKRATACSLQIDDSALEAYGYGVCPVVGAEFGKDILDVTLHRLFSNRELRTNFLIGITARDQAKNLNLAFGQSFIRCVFCQFGGDLGRNPLVSGVHQSDRVQQLFAEEILKQIPLSPGSERP